MDFLNTWVVPPVVGAVIGYITNWLAIKMLFRPFDEVRIFGLRMPFTPGLLPRERKRIARSIGQTVASELLTDEVVRRRLSEPDIRAALVKGIDGKLEKVLSARATAVLPKEALSSSVLGRLASGAWTSLVSSEAFREAVAQAVRCALVLAEDMPLSRLLPPDRARELAELVLSPENAAALRERLLSFVDEAYSGAADSGGRASGLGSLVPPEAVEPVLEVLAAGLYRAALPAIESFLGEPGVKGTIAGYARGIVRDALGRLNLLQRLIVSAAQYERGISDGMPRTVDDMVAAALAVLRGPDMPERAARAAVGAFRNAASRPLAESLGRVASREAARAAVEAAVDALAEHGPGVAQRAAAIAEAGSGATLASLLLSLGLPARELAARSALAVSKALSGAEDAREASRLLSESLSAFSAGLGTALGETTLGAAIGAGADARAELAGYLADRALELLSAEAGRIVEGLDVGRIVEERIDELDAREVERIVLDVANKELTWITVLGGVLGGAIGLIQSLFMYLRR